jgi:superkiller protein 3
MRKRDVFKSFIIIVLVLSFIYCGSHKKKINPVIRKYNTATVFLNNGKLAIAEKYLKEVIQKDPKFYLAYNNLGIIEIYKRNFDKAEQYLTKVIELKPTFLETYNYLGIVYREKGMNEKAKEMFLKVAENPNYPTRENGYYNLALINLSESKLDEALKYADKAIKTNSFFALGYNLRAKVLMRMKRSDDARRDYLKAIKLMPENPYFNFDLAMFLYKQEKKYDKATKFFERTMILSKDKNLRNICRKYLKEIEKLSNDKKTVKK